MPSCDGNVQPKRSGPLSYLKSYARRFSSGYSPQSSSSLNSTNGAHGLHRAFIALGSNVGDRVDMIEKACLELDRVNIKVKRTSSLFETTPMYVLDQDTFINGVCEVNSHHAFYSMSNRILTATRLRQVSRQWNFWIRSNLLRSSWAEKS
jgi:2-amino-4-hydroxy-6-hydroxymethyldihydropteridine diphosphokinase/dihydropteroate synthase